jgi:hypothetical protein
MPITIVIPISAVMFGATPAIHNPVKTAVVDSRDDRMMMTGSQNCSYQQQHELRDQGRGE